MITNRTLGLGAMASFSLLATATSVQAGPKSPNIVLMMADDLGYGDTGFNGNKIIKTPHMDKMAKDGAKLNHFYAGGPVCSPTRGTCLTGRHYFRYGIFSANYGHLPKDEITIGDLLKTKGYATGHFGKWHLGTLSKTYSTKGEGRNPEINFAPPWEAGYDRSFVVESSVSTWNPASDKNPFYDDGKPLLATDPTLEGGAARVVVDRAVPFMEKAVKDGKPFLATVWFNAPHEPIEAGPEYLKMYEGHGEAAHYYGCITEMDEQVGRIRKVLEDLNVDDNTLIFFCSDNGPEGKKVEGRKAGVTGGLRARKRSLYDGGVRVPAFAYWPGEIEAGSEINTPLSTLDYLPTAAALANYTMPDDRAIDGQDILPILTGKESVRQKDIPFRAKAGATFIQGKFKLVSKSAKDSKKDELYDLSKDWPEENNVISQYPEKAAAMKKELLKFLASAKQSHTGADYNNSSFAPVDPWQQFGVKGGKGKNKDKTNKSGKKKRK